jgi:hypothetical protein
MPTTSKRPRRLSDEDLQQVLTLLKGADSAELKLTVPRVRAPRHRRGTWDGPAGGPAPPGVLLRHPRPDPQPARVAVRPRHVQRRGDDSVIKLRPDRPRRTPRRPPPVQNLVVEVDAMAGRVRGFGIVDGHVRRRRGQVGGRRRPAVQQAVLQGAAVFYADHAPEGLDDLVILGPINLLKLKFSPGDYGRRPVAEPWFYPDGSQIPELSTKGAPSEAFQAAVETRTFLARQGVDLSGEQQTKTKTALGFFARSLKATADA